MTFTLEPIALTGDNLQRPQGTVGGNNCHFRQLLIMAKLNQPLINPD
ncbi:hypothetical protein [Laspinema palackyanum]|nr:hypothetical protein [Laspinema sp. D2c]